MAPHGGPPYWPGGGFEWAAVQLLSIDLRTNGRPRPALTAAFAAGHSIVGEKAARIAISETATD